MRVLQVATLAGPNAVAGGVWEVARAQSAALRMGGHDVRLISSWLGRPVGRLPTNAEIHRGYHLGRNPLRTTISPGLLRSAVFAMKSADLLHLHLCRDFATSPILQLARRSGVPVVVQTHGMIPFPAKKKLGLYDATFLRNWTTAGSVYLYLTEVEKISLSRHGVPEDRLLAIQNATPSAEKIWRPQSVTKFLFCARLHERKQPMVFVRSAINALDKLAESGKRLPTFVIAGPDEGEAARVQNAIARSQWRCQFTVLGALSHEAVQREMVNGAVYVLPSLNEPYPMAVLEAMSHGTPTILTNQTEISGLLQKAGAAMSIRPNVEELTLQMMALASDAIALESMHQAALRVHEKNWDLPSLGITLERAYEYAQREG